jgi:hypothetical protein
VEKEGEEGSGWRRRAAEVGERLWTSGGMRGWMRDAYRDP